MLVVMPKFKKFNEVNNHILKMKMKIVYMLSLALLVPILVGCDKAKTKKDQSYVFLNAYCETVTVGGVVGLAEKCFEVGDTVVGTKRTDGKITIRIADHSKLNEGPANSASFQEFIDVPSDYLKVLKK